MISSRQLEYFQAVARELHFTRAAAVLRIAQPALSQQIRKLERQLGLDLFERNNHRVELTPAGAALLKHAERILSDLTAVEEDMLGWAGGIRGRIRLGAARGLMPQLAQVLAGFCRTYPTVDVELSELNTQEMIAGLQAGRLDIATLAEVPAVGERSLSWYRLGEEPLVLVTGQQTRLAERDSISTTELDGQDLVSYPPGSAVGAIIKSSLAAADAWPRVRFESRDYTTARALASVGLAAAIMPASVAESPGAPVVIVRLDPEPVWTPAVAWSATRRPTPAQTAFTDYLTGHSYFASESSAGDISDD